MGRMSQKIAVYLQGKNKPTFKPCQADFSDVCVVVNASNIKLTGKRKFLKSIKYHTGYFFLYLLQ